MEPEVAKFIVIGFTALIGIVVFIWLIKRHESPSLSERSALNPKSVVEKKPQQDSKMRPTPLVIVSFCFLFLSLSLWTLFALAGSVWTGDINFLYAIDMKWIEPGWIALIFICPSLGFALASLGLLGKPRHRAYAIMGMTLNLCLFVILVWLSIYNW